MGNRDQPDLTEQRMPWVTPKPNKTSLSSQKQGILLFFIYFLVDADFFHLLFRFFIELILRRMLDKHFKILSEILFGSSSPDSLSSGVLASGLA
jgi:hypothetical protein